MTGLKQPKKKVTWMNLREPVKNRLFKPKSFRLKQPILNRLKQPIILVVLTYKDWLFQPINIGHRHESEIAI